MANPSKDSRYKEVLDELQLQSWQLELVISGFAIFGLFAALEPLFDWFTELKLKEIGLLRYLAFAIYFSCTLTITNLIIHVLLRGLWIGAVGIRSVSGEIDYERLGFSELTTKYLKKRIGSFDNFIERLEAYSSIMFGLSFMVIFITLGFFINFVLFLFFIGLITDSNLNGVLRNVFLLITAGTMLVFYLLIFIEFITKGALKKVGGKYHLLFYRLSSVLTLSVIYRPLLYNFWDNPFGTKLIRWLLPVYIAGILIFTSSYISTNYFSNLDISSNKFATRMNYWDMIHEKGDHIGYAAIPSKTITQPFLDVSIDYEQYLEEMIYEFDSTLRPKNSRIGFKSFLYRGFGWEFGGGGPSLAEEDKMLKTLNEVMVTRIDDILYLEPFEVVEAKNKSIYLKKYIDLSKLKNGKHLLTIQRRTSRSDSTKLEHYETIPFWYFKD